jgi:hypothetical protein
MGLIVVSDGESGADGTEDTVGGPDATSDPPTYGGEEGADATQMISCCTCVVDENTFDLL